MDTRRVSLNIETLDKRDNIKEIHIIELTFEIVSPLHIGSGMKSLTPRGDLLLKIQLREDGMPIIPASSFKGVTSINFLMLSGNATLTSDLFGTTRGRWAVTSKVFFNPLIPLKKEIQQVKIQREWKPRRRKRNHVKYYYKRMPPNPKLGEMEVIPSKITLSTEIVGFNLKPYELGGILMSVGLDYQGTQPRVHPIKLGYGKPQGFGQVRLINNALKLKILQNEILQFKPLANIPTPHEFITEFKTYIKKTDPNRRITDVFNKIFSWRE